MTNESRRDDYAQFYEEVGAAYPEEALVYHGLRGRLRREFVLSHLQEACDKVLDLGCNAGMYLAQMQARLAIGIDLSPTLLKTARQRCEGRSGRTYFVAGNIENLAFLHKIQFDLILCSEVLEHIPDPMSAFRGIARLLRPGGTAIITTPNFRTTRPEWVRMSLLRNYVAGDTYFHTAYRPEELSEMCAKVGLQTVEVGTLEWEIKYAAKLPALCYRLIRWLNNKTLRSESIHNKNHRFYENFILGCYNIAHRTGLEKIFKPLIREGVRSFIIMTKRKNPGDADP